MSDKRILIVNADDFGICEGVNRGILVAHEQGIVTSTSLMVFGSAATEAVGAAQSHPHLGVGLHVDLGEWTYRDGEWRQDHQVVDMTDAKAVAAEVARQVQRFRELMGRDPTHLDSHQHVHRDEPAQSVLQDWSQRLNIRLRHVTPGVRYCGGFYGQSGRGEPYHQAITAEALAAVIRHLESGRTELCCHPGFTDGLQSIYSKERELELKALCDPSVKQALLECGVQLKSFAQLQPLVRG